jgi:hypothetical protein
VPLFFLHVHNSAGDAVDDEGQDYADLDGARDAAIAGIRSLLGSELALGSIDLRGTDEIEDAQGRRVLSVPFAEALRIIT